MSRSIKSPTCLIIAGPNGAGKTTFAREFLPREGGIIHFVNADLIAAGLSPLKPTLAALRAGRLVLTELDRLAAARSDFALESTLSGQVYLERIARWKAQGYRIGNGLSSTRFTGHRAEAHCRPGPRGWPQRASR